jgi:hypothetical protein
MRLLLKKLLATTLGFTLTASLLAMVPVLLISDNAFAGTLETLTFSRNKVASIYDSQGRAPLDCYRNSGTCGGTKTETYEESVPSGGYFKIAQYPDPNRTSMFYVCDAANSCTGYGTGNIYAYKPGEYFLFRVQSNRFPKRDGLLVFSLGSANPYLASNGSTISWSFDSAILGQGIYNSPPTDVSTSVTGTYRVGDTLTGTESYSGVDVEIFSRQWKRSDYYRPLTNVGGDDITNATTNSYTLTDADLGQYIRYTFKTRNMQGNGSDWPPFGARSDYVIVQAALSAALTPELGTYTRTANGFTVAITNYNTAYTWAGTATNGGSVSFSGTNGNGLATITGVSPNTASVATITTTRTDYRTGTVTSVSTNSLGAALTPTVSSVTPTFGGFTFNVTNYNSAYTFSLSATSGTATAGTASGNSLPITVSGLSSGASATVSISTTRSGYVVGSGSREGTAKTSALTPTSGTPGKWNSSAISDDGQYVLLAGSGSKLFVSPNNGVDWNAVSSTRAWTSVATSSNGQKMLAGAMNSKLYLSTNYGATWSSKAASKNWRAVAMSANGNTLYGAVVNGFIFKSTNGGSSWSQVASQQNWRALATSQNGQVVIAAAYGGALYVSTDSGSTWKSRENTRNWSSVSIADDGTAMVATVAGGGVYLSSDSGESWSAIAGVERKTWNSVSCDATCSKFAISSVGGSLNLLSSQGVALAQPVTLAKLSTVTLNSLGTQIIAGATTGGLRRSVDSGTNWTQITRITL